MSDRDVELEQAEAVVDALGSVFHVGQKVWWLNRHDSAIVAQLPCTVVRVYDIVKSSHRMMDYDVRVQSGQVIGAYPDELTPRYD